MSSKKNPVIYKVAIMILPIGVLIGTAAFMWAYYDNHKEKENRQSIIISSGIREKDITDILSKLTNDIDARDTKTEEGKRAHRQALILIEGRLGPINTGFQIKRGQGKAFGDELWRSLWVDVRGKDKKEEVLVVATSIEGRGNSSDGNLIASMMTLAISMAKDEPARTVRFVFLPLQLSASDQTAWLLDYCVGKDERCVGIIGLQEMEGEILLGNSEWRFEPKDEKSKQWWQYITAGKTYESEEDRVPTIWVTHPVYSNETWKNAMELRVDATIPVISQFREWVVRACQSGL